MDAAFKLSGCCETQRKGESIHSPETCLPGSRWEFKKAGTVTLPIQTRRGEAMTVNRAIMEPGAAYQLCYFWFPQHTNRCLPQAQRSSSPPKPTEKGVFVLFGRREAGKWKTLICWHGGGNAGPARFTLRDLRVSVVNCQVVSHLSTS